MAPPARRRKKGLEPNLYESKGYYRYRHPVTKKEKGMGKNKAQANAAARQLNAMFMQGGDLVENVLVSKVRGMDSKTIADVVDHYRTNKLPSKGLKPNSEYNEKNRLNRIEQDIGDEYITTWTTQHCAAYLDKNFEKNPYVKHRTTLKEIFAYAKRKGWYEGSNPVEATESKSKEGSKKTRKRMTKEQFKQLYDAADPWLQNAMQISLITLQARNEIVSMKFEDIDEERNTIRIIREKSDKNEWAFLELEIPPTMNAVIKRCRRSGLVSPFLIHREPERRVKSEVREHWTQVLPDYLSKAVDELTSGLSLFKSMPKPERPTFHEIRSLGSFLYKKQGYDDKDYVQKLMAHGDVEMTRKYQAGHEVEWTPVRADLDISVIFGK